MKNKLNVLKLILLLSVFSVSANSSANMSSDDSRELVKFPEMMQQHMMANMRDHVAALNEILEFMGNNQPDKAADVAENRLGMSSLDNHGASHMASMMPKGMQAAGTSMHRAASRFALKAQEGDLLPAYKALSDITAACVSCHTAYRIR
ncbi:hypothetical protein [uncultured Cocleimonas sp.]|uniref:hypothetical protein n=1 Tax=uncultured Cocleimonas sp. TaxID=1051587 RepID=UPI0026313001|nr:hypothetical protein [uncultured Cocleimonas sp.]